MAVSTLIGYHFIGIEIVCHETSRIGDGEAVAIGVHGEGVLVGATEHVATPTELLVRQTKLCQQSGWQVGLVAERSNQARALDGTTSPNHWNTVAIRLRLVGACIVIAMVRQQDNQRVLPLGQLLELVDKLAYTMIEIVECIEYLVVVFLEGHIPWLMTAECGIAYETWLFRGLLYE